jgi:transglutaminase-like putative cysteine protease
MFLEWLLPLTDLADGGEVVIVRWFMVLTACLLLTGSFKLPFALNSILPMTYVAIVLMMIYGHGISLAWYWDFFTIVEQDILNIVNTGDWHNLSAESRALVLLIGWSMLVLSVLKLVSGKRSILLFLFITIFYLILLQTYTEASILGSLYRAVAEGLLIQAWLFVFGMSLEENKTSLRSTEYPLQAKRWLFGSMIIVLCCVTGAIYVSKQLHVTKSAPYSWQETVQAFSSWGESKNLQSNSSHAQRESGYSQNDRVLGAPLTLRHEPYFIASSPVPTYWRGESKDYYNGQGWQSMTTSTLVTNNDAQVELGLGIEGSKTKQPEIVQRIFFINPIQQEQVLFTGGIPLRVPTLYSGQSSREHLNVPIRYDAMGQSLISAQPSSMVKSYQSYDIAVAPQPIVSEDLRQNDRNEQNEKNTGEDPAWVVQHYLQLPEALPKRVSSLAEQLTSNITNRYDAVMEIKHYLEKNYRYDLKTTPPFAKQDFVDHFLFEQKVGYCDHFSTSMVVLLRSSGIPARWVKGFAPGSLLTTSSEKRDGTQAPTSGGSYENRYLVSYADAHSWVEVYFEGVGFVPFDPTPGYDGKTSVMNRDELMSGIGKTKEKWKGTTLDKIWTSLASWWGSGAAKFNEALKQITYMSEAMLAYILRHPIAVTFVVAMPIMMWLIMAGMTLYGGMFVFSWSLKRNRVKFFSNPIRFPTRDILLFSSKIVWNKLSQKYGEKQGMLTPREYVQQLIATSSKMDEESRQHLLSFILIWEQLYYGGVTLSRQETTTFLTLCWKMVKP